MPEEAIITDDNVPWIAGRGYEITCKCHPHEYVRFSDLGFQSESIMKSLEAPKCLGWIEGTAEKKRAYQSNLSRRLLSKLWATYRTRVGYTHQPLNWEGIQLKSELSAWAGTVTGNVQLLRWVPLLKALTYSWRLLWGVCLKSISFKTCKVRETDPSSR